MQVKNMKKVADLLEQAGFGEEFIEANHDIIYLPIHEKKTLLAPQLTEAGAHYEAEYGCWVMYC